MYKAIDVAYCILKLAQQKGLSMTNLKLQKLVYIAHGYKLGLCGSPLIDEAPQAWKYGPVIHSVYYQFKSYADRTINIDTSKIRCTLKEEDQTIIADVLDLYGADSAIDLVNLTHEADTPWDEVWNKQKGRRQLFAEIPDELIKNHFLKAVTDSSSVNGL